MKKVSIIVPVYNVEKYLRECLDSLINQTYSNIEIICVNDGSTDNSLNILKDYAQKDHRIEIIDKKNGGLLSARLDGLERASGEYIMNVDSDDYVEKNAVEILLGYAQQYKADIIRFFCYDNSTGLPLSSALFLERKNFEPCFFDILYGSYALNSAVLNFFRRDILKLSRNLDTTISLGEDLEYNLNLYENAGSILLTNEKLYYYRKNPDSITHEKSLKSIFQNIESAHKVYTRLFESVGSFNDIKNRLKYRSIAATRYIIEVYYLELKLLGMSNRKNLSSIMANIADNHKRLEDKGIVELSNEKLMKRYSRGHTLYLVNVYHNRLRLARIYAKTIYRFGLIIRRIVK